VVARQGGIGGSDAAAIIGVSPWARPIDIYFDKIGKPQEKTSPAMEWGQKLEPVIRDYYASREGITIATFENTIFLHREHDWMRASIDGYIPSRHALLEIKTGRLDDANAWNPVPPYYYAQVQHYLAVLELERAEVIALLGGQEFIVRRIERDEPYIRNLIAAEARFWNEHVLKRTPPAPVTVEDVQSIHPRSTPNLQRPLNDEIAALIRRYVELQTQQKGAEEEMERIKTAICDYIGEAEGIVDANGRPVVTWKSTAPSARVDVQLLKTLYPDVYQRVLVSQDQPGPRRFLVKSVPAAGLEIEP
jgi:putative phage-type endonuclease